ncbi:MULTISPECIES: hypothetical protein [Pontibacillus]|uniref:DUF2007 domain-containing protein n=1 Tax=Pontibacillus chungwhensis TaxID=265426 RepID=A0ABY8UW54_9BACI|nr:MULTISPECIES: hypothetical protein [Pontibacillus]MCD5324230.1 hypothetical protein [Pontibacillus sp. HN14]WIF97714.1 hypothetical protein QNI29_18610 [Pontibacillus chungwhensis]
MLNAVLLTLCVVLAVYLYVFEKKDELSVIFRSTEKEIGKAQELYWLLKNNHLTPYYSIPYNKRNIFEFGYFECEVIIEVPAEQRRLAIDLVEEYGRNVRRGR